jgi:hypothetical protein
VAFETRVFIEKNMALRLYATRTAASKLKLRNQDYRTIGKLEPDAVLVKSDGRTVSLYEVNPLTQTLLNQSPNE